MLKLFKFISLNGLLHFELCRLLPQCCCLGFLVFKLFQSVDNGHLHNNFGKIVLHFGNSLISFQICGECFGVRVKLFLFHLHQFFFDAVHFFFLLVDHCLHLVHDICTVVYLLKLAIYFFFLNVIFRTVRFSQSPPCFIFDLVLSICFGLTASKALFITLVDRKLLGDLGLRWAILEISSMVYLPWVGAFLLIFQMIQMI